MTVHSILKTLAAVSLGVVIGAALAGRPQVRAQTETDNPLAPEIVDPEHYKIEFENSYVRVIRCKIPARDKVKMHRHPVGSVVVLLSDQNLRQTEATGAVRDVHRNAKEVFWGNPNTHMGENIGDQLYEYIRVDVKAAR
jgi:hypothetical protein